MNSEGRTSQPGGRSGTVWCTQFVGSVAPRRGRNHEDVLLAELVEALLVDLVALPPPT